MGLRKAECFLPLVPIFVRPGAPYRTSLGTTGRKQCHSSFFSFRLFFSTINPYGQTAVQIPQTCPL